MAWSRRWTAVATIVAVLMVLAALSLPRSTSRVAAQDDGDEPHPAHIHSGTCADLGDIVAPLADVTAITEGEVEGSGSAVPIKVSETEVELPLADILAAPHALNVHRSAEAIEEYIACGDIGGRVVEGRLVIGLLEIGGSDHSGVAVLEEDDDETDVTVYLAEEGSVAAEEPAATDAGDGDETPVGDDAATAEAVETPEVEGEVDETATTEPAADEEATTEADAEATTEPEEEATTEPAADDEQATEEAEAEAPEGEEVAVDIVNFSYNPNPVEIAAGDTVTWTNQDGVPHTATGQDRDVLQSGAIASGDSFSETFEEAGEFEYFCEFHPGMVGTIVVE